MPVLAWTVQVHSACWPTYLGRLYMYSSFMLDFKVSWGDNNDLHQTLLAELLAQQTLHDPRIS